MLSVVLPAYNEEKMIQKAADTIDRILNAEKIPYEIVFVNDGSKDRTWEEIERAAGRNPNVTGVNFSRNFGKESAMYAGLASASGDCCAVMDCDLQHPPETLVEMYRLWEQGYEVVEGVKHSRGKESALHKASAGLFYKLIKYAVKNIVSFSTVPMQCVTVAGVFVFLLAIVLGIQSLVRYFSGHAVEGFTTVILLILIIGSIIMISLGIIGYYIAKIYEEVKGRPRYLISRKLERRAAGEEHTEPAGHGKPADD